MPAQVSSVNAGSDQIVDLLLRHASKEDLKRLVDHANAASGKIVSAVSFEPGDDICPTWKFPHPFPPKFIDFLGELTKLPVTVKVFPLGLIATEEIIIQARFAAGD